jgi:actin-related protein
MGGLLGRAGWCRAGIGGNDEPNWNGGVFCTDPAVAPDTPVSISSPSYSAQGVVNDVLAANVCNLDRAPLEAGVVVDWDGMETVWAHAYVNPTH